MCLTKRCSCKKGKNVCTTLCTCTACKNLEGNNVEENDEAEVESEEEEEEDTEVEEEEECREDIVNFIMTLELC